MFKSWYKNILRRLRSNIKIGETGSQRMKLGRAVAEKMIKLLVFRRKAVGKREDLSRVVKLDRRRRHQGQRDK